jgi:TonB family protein
MRFGVCISTALVCAGAPVSLILSQQASAADSARCVAALNAPTSDSAIIEEDAIFTPFDTTRKLPDSYADFIGQGMRQMLVLPRPLAIDTYDDRAGVAKSDAGSKQYATVALRSFYRLTLHRDGHLTNAHVVGGVRNDAFDRAVIVALVALDSSGMLPAPLGFDDSFEADTLELRLTITNGSISSTRSKGQARTAQPGVTPLFRLRVPVLPVDRPLAAQAGNPYPRYPEALRDRNIEGDVRSEFLVRADGSVDSRSVQIRKTTALEFASAVLNVVPQWRFFPLEVAGCRVASLVQMPSAFRLR